MDDSPQLLPPAPKQAPAVDHTPPDLRDPDLLKGLPRWQRQYLSARASGSDERRAVLAARSSDAIIRDHYLASQALADGGAFARAYDAVVKGVVVAGGPAAVRARHLESADAILDHFTDVALNRDVEPARHRDQISAGDRVLQAAQLIGQGAQVQVQVSTTLSVAPNPRATITGRVVEVPAPGLAPGAGTPATGHNPNSAKSPPDDTAPERPEPGAE